MEISPIGAGAERCRDLASRCEVFGDYAKALDGHGLAFPAGLKTHIGRLQEISDQGQVKRLHLIIFSSRAIAAEYQDLKARLEQWVSDIGNEISQRKELGILDQKQVDQDDSQFDADLKSTQKHKRRIKQMIVSDVGEDKQEKTMIDSRDLEIGAEIGKFVFGTVHEGFLRKKHFVAFRVIDRDIDLTTLSIIKRDIFLTWNLQDCDYILRTHGTVLSKDKKWMIVSGNTALGSLNDFFKKKRFEISKTVKIQLARKIAVGLDYLHSCDVIHKDLRSHNIMITDSFDPKITGFELCREVTAASGMIEMDPMVKRWWAPERLEGRPSSKELDVYSFGMLMYEISFGEELPENGIDEGFESGVVHEEYSKILDQCIRRDPKERPTMEQVRDRLTALEAEFVNE